MHTRDPLTALPTRISFLKAIELTATAARLSHTPLSLLVAAIDTAPDGRHASTDHAVLAVSSLIRLAGGRLAIVARLSQGSFAMLFPQTPLDAAFVRAQVLCATTRQNGADFALPVTLSIGVACGPAGGDWLGDELLSHADARCGAAMAAGGDTVHAFDAQEASPSPLASQAWPSLGRAAG